MSEYKVEVDEPLVQMPYWSWCTVHKHICKTGSITISRKARSHTAARKVIDKNRFKLSVSSMSDDTMTFKLRE